MFAQNVCVSARPRRLCLLGIGAAACVVAAALPGVAHGQRAVTRPLALQGEPAPGAAEGVRYGLFSFFAPVTNDAGATTYINPLAGPGVTDQNDRAAFVRRPDGATTLFAREGTPAPGLGAGVLFREVYDVPVLNDAGNVAFYSTLRGTGVVFDSNDSALFTGTPAALVPLARRGGQAAGMPGGVVHARIDPFAQINEPGQVAYRSILGGPGVTAANNEALFVATPASTTLAARRGSPAPGMPAGVTYGTFRGLGDFSFDRVSLNDAGHLAYRATVTGPGVSLNGNDSVLYAGPAGAPSVVARMGDTPVGVADAGAQYGGFGNFVHNDAGRVAFGAELRLVDSATDYAIYAGPAAAPKLVARKGDAVPGAAPGVVYRQFGNPAINETGGVAFSGFVAEGPAGTPRGALFAGREDAVRPVLFAGDAIPGDPDYRYAGFEFFAPALNDAGQLAFTASLTTGANNNAGRGLFLWDPVLGDLLIARERGLFDVGGGVMRRVSSSEAIGFVAGAGDDSGTGAGNDGRFVFRLIFDDGSSGVFSAVVPEPSGLLPLAAGGLLLRRRRPA